MNDLWSFQTMSDGPEEIAHSVESLINSHEYVSSDS